jgi:hypothetical protein
MKSIQIINKIIAREKNISEDLVEKINKFYWKKVRAALSDFSDTSVSVKHIGTITVSRRKLNFFILQLIRKIRVIRAGTKHKESTKALLLETNINKLRKALVQRNIIAKLYYEDYQARVEKYKRVHRIDSSNSSELGQSDRGNDQPSEAAIQSSTGGRATGDSETQVDMRDLPISQ